MGIDIELFLQTAAGEIENKKVPVVDLIAVQTKDPYKVLIATILSARTKDETTAVAAARLFKKAPDLQSLAEIPQAKLEKLIYPVGFYRNKASFLAKLPDAMNQFDNIIPETIEELIKLPGVGRKTANLVVSVAFKKDAICVDTHVHRIMNLWGYVNTKDPLETEMALRGKLPRQFWITVNSILVAFGQSICRPVGPHCDICRLQPDCPQLGVKPRRTPTSKNNTHPSKTLISWNVNGIRAIEKKGFSQTIKELGADIIAIQETRAQLEQLSDNLINMDGYYSFWNSGEKKGYSGVAVYSRNKPLNVTYGFGVEEFDREGRVITLEFNNFFLINVYFPNSGEELKRLDFKLRFNRLLHAYGKQLADKKSVIICGDYNVAHKPIDLKNPKANETNAGYTIEERQWMDSFLNGGFVDTFRMFNKEPENYTWWSYRFNARAKNIGWRIDYFCVDMASKSRVQNSEILGDIMGSDHCPVKMDFLMER